MYFCRRNMRFVLDNVKYVLPTWMCGNRLIVVVDGTTTKCRCYLPFLRQSEPFMSTMWTNEKDERRNNTTYFFIDWFIHYAFHGCRNKIENVSKSFDKIEWRLDNRLNESTVTYIDCADQRWFTCTPSCSHNTLQRTRRKSLIWRRIRFCISTVSFE
jgi:hypothetical protein